jgi:hypothetical protein
MKRLAVAGVCAAVLSLAVPPVVAAQSPDEAHRKDIERLLEITGASQMGVQMATMISGQILDSLSKGADIPPKAIEVAKDVLNQEFKKAFEGPEGLTALIVAVYAKHFSHAEVRDLLAFYETPLGRKMISVTPAIFQESAAAGQGWAERNMARINAAVEARLRAEGFIK